MLEEDRIYLLKTTHGSVWLFKKYIAPHIYEISSCSHAICLDDMYKTYNVCYVCNDNEIAHLKYANENYIAIWNREFNDNIDL